MPCVSWLLNFLLLDMDSNTNTSRDATLYNPFCGVTAVRREWMRRQAEDRQRRSDAERREKICAKRQKRRENELHELLTDAINFREWSDTADQPIIHFLNGKYGDECKAGAQRRLARQPFMGVNQVRTTANSLIGTFSNGDMNKICGPRARKRRLFFFSRDCIKL